MKIIKDKLLEVERLARRLHGEMLASCDDPPAEFKLSTQDPGRIKIANVRSPFT
jgi:hypothetical protein